MEDYLGSVSKNKTHKIQKIQNKEGYVHQNVNISIKLFNKGYHNTITFGFPITYTTACFMREKLWFIGNSLHTDKKVGTL